MVPQGGIIAMRFSGVDGAIDEGESGEGELLGGQAKEESR
jgi:hypothetical protein